MGRPRKVLPEQTQEQDPTKVMGRWRSDPVFFVREIIGVKSRPGKPGLSITPQQMEGLDAVRRIIEARMAVASGKIPEDLKDFAGVRGLSITSGQGTGKDAFAAWVIIWTLICFPNFRGLVTAPAAHQIENVTFKEVSLWLNAMDQAGGFVCKVRDLIVVQTDKIYLKQNKDNAFYEGRTARPNASAAEQAETLAGRHADYFVVLAEEASGIPDAVFKPLEGTMTGKCNFEILIFNPTRRSGYAYASQWGEARGQWCRLRWDSEMSPIVNQENIRKLEAKYGRNSNTFRIRVKGLPPESEEGTLIPWEWVEQSYEYEFDVPEDTKTWMAIDVGRQGDPSAIAVRRGPRVLEIREFKRDDLTAVVTEILGAIREWEPDVVFIDMNGIGYGVHDPLVKLTDVPVIGVNVSEVAQDQEHFDRLRDELWWRLRERFESGKIQIPREQKEVNEFVSSTTLQEELTAPTYEILSNGKIKVESKKKMKSRGRASPNRADALALLFFWPDEDIVQKKKPMIPRSRVWRQAYRGNGWMGV